MWLFKVTGLLMITAQCGLSDYPTKILQPYQQALPIVLDLLFHLHIVSWNESDKYWIYYLWSNSASVMLLACSNCFVNISQPILSHCKERHGMCFFIWKRKLKYREVKYHVQSHAVHRWQSQETSWVLNPKSCSASAIWITWGPGDANLIWA